MIPTAFNIRYQKHLKLVLYGVLVIEFIRLMVNSGKVSLTGSTYLVAAIEYLSLLVFFRVALGSRLDSRVPLVIKSCFLLWISIGFMNFLRGGIIASNYWDYKFLFLVSFSFTSIALVFYVGVNQMYFRAIYQEFFSKVIWLALLSTPFLYYFNHQSFARAVIPITFFLCVAPFVNNRTRIFLFAIAATSVVLALDFRTNLIKTALAIGVLILYALSKKTTTKFYTLTQNILFFVPVLLLVLGLTSTFNIFAYTSQMDIGTVTDSVGRQVRLSGDTRSFLYREIIASVMKSNNVIFGESSSGSYKSFYFFDTGGAIRDRRYASEVGILNIFLYYGLLGVVSYFLLLYCVSRTAIVRSNNHISKMFGVLIASRWALSFIEEYTRYDMNFFFFWLVMGLVSTESFRAMSDVEAAYLFQELHRRSRFFHRFLARMVGKR